MSDSLSYKKPKTVSIKNHSVLTEQWVQNLIAEDPSILGLGDLVLRDRERIQPKAGRLDLLLQDSDTQRRYEVEIQLGASDESHIVRTIEYWDIERKRYPQYDHCAVIIAEDITSRFLNVISLFNGSIPIIAIQMKAIEVGEHTTLFFTTVLDEMTRGLVDEDEDAEAAPTDRHYWEKRATKRTLAMTDQMLELAKQIDPSLKLKYNKFYIGLEKEGQPFNFLTFRPKKNQLNLEIKLSKTEEYDDMIDKAEIDTLEYSKRYSSYQIRLSSEDILGKSECLKTLAKAAFDRRNS